MASRRSQLAQHTILCAKRDALETKIGEQEQYKSITAQGDNGSSTEFVSLDSLERSLARVLNSIATIERQLGL